MTSEYDYLFKLLLIGGDSGVGKSYDTNTIVCNRFQRSRRRDLDEK
ncbi:unnamed protein product [Rhodiola kirilowii]